MLLLDDFDALLIEIAKRLRSGAVHPSHVRQRVEVLARMVDIAETRKAA